MPSRAELEKKIRKWTRLWIPWAPEIAINSYIEFGDPGLAEVGQG